MRHYQIHNIFTNQGNGTYNLSCMAIMLYVVLCERRIFHPLNEMHKCIDDLKHDLYRNYQQIISNNNNNIKIKNF